MALLSADQWYALLLAVGGAILGALAPRLFEKRKSLRFDLSTIEILAPQLVLTGELQVAYRGEVFPQVTVCRLTLWNDGSLPLDRDDIAPANPIAVEVTDGDIIQCAITSATDPGLDPRIERQHRRRFVITFDYLDPRDGLELTCVHSGNAQSLRVVGSVRGLKHGIGDSRRRRPVFTRRFVRIFIVALGSLITLNLIAATLSLYNVLLVKAISMLSGFLIGLAAMDELLALGIPGRKVKAMLSISAAKEAVR